MGTSPDTSQSPTRDALAKTNPAPVLEYRQPTTPGPARPFFGLARYPLGVMLLCAIATVLVPNKAGGSGAALVTSLILIGSGCWYLVARIVADRRYRIFWRAILSAAAVCCVVTVAYLSAWGQLKQNLLMWEVYHHVTVYLYALFYTVGGLIVVGVAAWIDRQISRWIQNRSGQQAK